MSRLEQHRIEVDKCLAALNVARQRVQQEQTALESAEAKAVAYADALVLAQTVAQQVQQQAHARIADVVTRSLAAVFDEPYVFKIKFERKRNRTEASLVFERQGLEVDPMTAAGGGVIDVAAFALRLACLMLQRPAVRRLLVMDEPFRFVSVNYRPRLRTLLDQLAREMDCQFIIVTHDPHLTLGTVIDLTA